MATSTTQSIWRSGGGDQSRTAYCGSGVMAAEFYIDDASVATATRVKVSNATNAPDLILPAGAVVIGVSITAETGSGTFDLGATGVSSGTANDDYIASGVTVAVGTTAAGTVVSAAPLAELSYVTVMDNVSGTGTVTGFITYFVQDPLLGQQSA